MKFRKKLLYFLLPILFFSYSLAPAYAACGTPDPAPSTFWDNVVGVVLGDENTIRSLTQGMTNGMIDSAFTATAGCPVDCIAEGMCKGAIMGQGSSAYGNGGLLGVASGTLHGAFDAPPSASLAMFVHGAKSESLIFKEAHAAPVSQPFMRVFDIWKGFRNLAYGLLAIMVLAISIMISMRQKIDPQTVVMAQAALPKIVISAVLITFSYAIGAAFDQMIGTGFNSPLVRVAYSLFWGTGGASGQQFQMQLDSGNYLSPECQLLISVTQSTECILEGLSVVAKGGSLVVGTAVVFLAALIFMVVLLFAAVGVYIFNYLKIILLTIISPLIFAFAALPGQEKRIKDWFAEMLTAVLSLPAMVFLILLGIWIFLNTTWINSPDVPNPGLISTALGPFVGGALLFGVWILAIRAPGMIGKAIKGPQKR